jgi:hypothetical protein
MADNTASLVVALSAQLTKFEKDMRAAGIMADKAVGDIEDKFSKMNPKISTSFFGNFFSTLADKAISTATSALEGLIARFKELQKTAEYTDTSMQWVFGLQEAFRKSGASVEEVNTAIRSVAASLDEMKRGGDNALKTLLDANPQFLKGFNRDTATAEETMRRVLTIISEMPNMIQAVDVGKNVGVPAGVAAAAFKEGAAAIEKIAAEAAKAAPDLDRLANQGTALASTWDNFLKGFKSSALEATYDILKKIAEIAVYLGEGEVKLFKNGPLEGVAQRELEKWQGVLAILNKVDEKAASAEGRARVKISGGTAVDPFARKATGGADPMDDFDRQAKSIEKHTNAMVAEAATLGESAHAQEEYRVQLLLTEAALQKNNEISQETQDAIAGIAARAAGAKQQLAEASFAMQRLNSASQQVGSALSTAFADAIVEGKSLNDVVGSLIKTLEKAAINATVMSLFSPGAGGTTSPFASLFKGFAGGTDFAPGGMAMVGEHGPELVNLPRGSQVIPNDVLRSGSGGGGAIVYSPAIDARGASVEAVARLAQIMEQDRATFASRTVATIQQARRGRVPGL